jgi:hypothetical protein
MKRGNNIKLLEYKTRVHEEVYPLSPGTKDAEMQAPFPLLLFL